MALEHAWEIWALTLVTGVAAHFLQELGGSHNWRRAREQSYWHAEALVLFWIAAQVVTALWPPP